MNHVKHRNNYRDCFICYTIHIAMNETIADIANMLTYIRQMTKRHSYVLQKCNNFFSWLTRVFSSPYLY